MSAVKTYRVIEADYLDEEDGIKKGAVVTAEPNENASLLTVTHVGEKELRPTVSVFARQLQELAA